MEQEDRRHTRIAPRRLPEGAVVTHRGGTPNQGIPAAGPSLTIAEGQRMEEIRILIAEDDLIIAAMLGELVAGMGHTVCAIETTETGAINAAARCRPDLVIADISLSEGSGVSAIDAILRTGPVPYLLISGNISGITRLRPDAMAIQKPFHAAELERAIHHVLLRRP
jgi:CheY-like chemotaxis protein